MFMKYLRDCTWPGLVHLKSNSKYMLVQSKMIFRLTFTVKDYQMMLQFLYENISSFHAISNPLIVKTYATNIKAIKTL